MLHNTLQTNATQMAPANRGTAVSLFASCFFLGQSTGVSIASAMVEWIGTPAVFTASALLLIAIATAFAAALRRRPAALVAARISSSDGLAAHAVLMLSRFPAR